MTLSKYYQDVSRPIPHPTKLIKISSPGWEIDVTSEQDAAAKLWPHICKTCKSPETEEPEWGIAQAKEGDLYSMLQSPCGCEFMIEYDEGEQMTEETKFTPGPWLVVTNHPTNAAVSIHAKCEGWQADELATLYGPHEGEEDENGVWPLGETRMANARLIAAAPDLYAALDNLVKAYKALSDMTGHTFHESECSYYQIAITALTKARGE